MARTAGIQNQAATLNHQCFLKLLVIEAFRRLSGACFGGLWERVLGRSGLQGAPQGQLGAVLGRHGTDLGPPWGCPGASWGRLGPTLSHFGSHLGAPNIAAVSAGVVFRENSRF